jgi:PAS domain S-box-containing protein
MPGTAMQQFSTRRILIIGFAIFLFVLCFFAWYIFAQKEATAINMARVVVIGGIVLLLVFAFLVRKMFQKKMNQESIPSSRNESSENYMKLIENYHSLINTVDGIVWEADAQSFQFTFVSKQAERLLGYPVERWTEDASFWKDHIHPEDNWAIDFCLQSVRNKRSHEFEYRMVAADGKAIWVHDFVTVVVEKDKAIKLRGIMVDVTERKKSEQTLRTSEEITRLIMNSSLDAIVCMNPEGKITIWSSQAEKIFGWKEKEVIGKYLSETVIPVQYRERHKQGLAKYLQTGEGPALNRILEISALDNTGREFPIELSIIPVKQNNSLFFCGFLRDITQRKKAEEELARSYAAIRELTDHIQKIREEERSNIAREIHDELGQQLTVLKMDISWLNKKIGADDEPSKQKIQNLTEVLDGTVKTVRRISSELRPSLLDDLGLIAAIEWHLREFEQHSGTKTEFDVPDHNLDLPDEIKTGLFRVLQETLTNVARHADASKVKVSLQRKNGNIVLCIEDNGQGFDEQSTINKRTLGILGMQERTSMMGGSYEIKSVPGRGTTVIVSVPELIQKH